MKNPNFESLNADGQGWRGARYNIDNKVELNKGRYKTQV